MNKKDYEEFLRHCQIVTKLSDDRTLLRVNQTQELIVMRKMQHVSADLICILSQQKQIMHEHLESIIDYCQISPDSVYIFTQYSTHTLSQQLKARKKSNTKFSLQDLQNIIVSVLKALKYLESKLIGHGCISSSDIVISSNGTVKLIDPSLATSSPFNLVSGYSYSPQLLIFNRKQIQAKGNNSLCFDTQQIDFFKNDVFVLGLLIIELGLLQSPVDECFKYDQGYFDYNQLDKYLNQLQCLFPYQSLINLLCGMLQQDPAARLTTQGALNFIEQQFGNQQDLDPDSDGLEESSGSYLYESKDKTVRSFLLSQGPVSSQGESLRSSREQQTRQEWKVNKFSVKGEIKNGKHSLIKI